MKPFRFKKFSIEHNQSAMKVGTDGLLLGAWAVLQNNGNSEIHDVGSGTGLIGLMLAQRFSRAKIVGFEIEEASAREGQRNFDNAPFANERKVVLGDWTKTRQTQNVADLIVSNPPFFASRHILEDPARQVARQEGSLLISDLISHAFERTTTSGSLAVVLPSDREDEANIIAQKTGWHLWRKMKVQRSANHPFKRVLIQWNKRPMEIEEKSLTLFEDKEWTAAYKQLTGEFHL